METRLEKGPIVIQGAMQSELQTLLENMDSQKKVTVGELVFYECIYKDLPIIISKTKIGEIASAIATTVAIQRYEPALVINQGTAGALVRWLHRGDIVVGKEIYYISQYSTEPDKEEDIINPWKRDGYRTKDGEALSYKANEELIALLESMEHLKKDGVYFDIIASGDVWTKSRNLMERYNSLYGVVCEAMECSGAYLAASTFGTPLVSLRVISNNEITGEAFDEETGAIAQMAALRIIDELILKHSF